MSADDRDWAERAEIAARTALREREKEISEEALSELVSRVGPNARQLESEIEKLCVFRRRPDEESNSPTWRRFVRGTKRRGRSRWATRWATAICRACCKRLDEELWETKLDPKKSEIGLLYGLISKVRAMLLLKEMLREGWIKPEMDYNRFKAQLERVPADKLPADRRFNPLAMNPYVLYKALPQVKKYSQSELVRAMDLLLRCNQRLVGSGLGRSAGVAASPGADCRAAMRSRPEINDD